MIVHSPLFNHPNVNLLHPMVWDDQYLDLTSLVSSRNHAFPARCLSSIGHEDSSIRHVGWTVVVEIKGMN